MISTQRLLLIVVILNILLTMAGEIYLNPSTVSYTAISTQNTLVETTEYELTEEGDGIWDWFTRTTVFQTGEAIWNMVGLMGNVLILFLKSLIPLPINPANYTTPIERSVAYALQLMRTLTSLILIIEAILFAISKKST